MSGADPGLEGGNTGHLEGVTVDGVHTPSAWCYLQGVQVLDPDGWRIDGKSFDEPITHLEFARRCCMSTTSQRRWSE